MNKNFTNNTMNSAKSVKVFIERMSDAFNQNLSDIEIIYYDKNVIKNGKFMIPAFTKSNIIYIEKDFSDINSKNGQILLAHELAHVCQKKSNNYIGVLSDDQIEYEAHLAAVCALEQGWAPRVSHDGADKLRPWGWAGHYYTVYFTALATGHTSLAPKLAFFAQMPDQVDLLDAAEAGIGYFKENPSQLGGIRGEFRLRHAAAQCFIPDKVRLQIQQGLHCLTGRNPKDELSFRIDNLDSLDSVDKYVLLFGLGLHALGDVFAHQKNDNEMYKYGIGHLKMNFSLGKDTDNINLRKELYLQYCIILYEYLSKRSKNRNYPFDKNKYFKNVSEFSDISDEFLQIKRIRVSSFAYAGASLGPYEPELEGCLSWENFQRKHADYVNYRTLDEALSVAYRWSLGDLVQKSSHVNLHKLSKIKYKSP